MRYRVICTYRLISVREVEAETEEELDEKAWEIRQATNVAECECLDSDQDIQPIEEEEQEQRCCVCGLPAEGGAEQVCACTCPECGNPCFDDVTFCDHGRCYDCQKQWQLRPVTKDDDEKENPPCSSSSTFPCI